MKKTYSTPEIESVVLRTTPLLSTSDLTGGGDDSGSGNADSKEWQGGFVWEDYEVNIGY